MYIVDSVLKMAADCISVPVVEHAQLRVHDRLSVKGSLCISPSHIQFVSLQMDIDDLRVRVARAVILRVMGVSYCLSTSLPDGHLDNLQIL